MEDLILHALTAKYHTAIIRTLLSLEFCPRGATAKPYLSTSNVLSLRGMEWHSEASEVGKARSALADTSGWRRDFENKSV